MPKLVIKSKAEVIKEYIIGKNKITIGTSKENNIVLDDESVSEEHCIINQSEGKFFVEDLNTAFGTSVNGRSISKQEINLGDEVIIGNHSVVMKPYGKEKDTKEKSAMGAGQPEAYLLGIQGKMYGRKYELTPAETKIGRSKDFNDIWIPKEIDKSVSRRHTTIKFADGKYILTDRRSRNRTFVNQLQVNETDEIEIKDSDEILIGKSIFRFIIGQKENYSLPKKAGIFWVRFMPKLMKIFAVIILLLSLFMGNQSMTGLSTINSKPVEIYLDDLGWNPEGFSRSWKGYLSEEVLDIIPSPAIGDINADNIPEVVVGDAMGRVYAWSGLDGALIWKSEIGQSMVTSPVLADVNNDKVLDVIIGSDNSRLYILDGLSGQMLYKSDFIGGKILFASSPLVEDLDGDGFKDIVVVTDDKVICFIYSPIIGSQKPYYFNTPENILSSPVFLQSEDGPDQVAVATNGGKIYLFDVLNPENKQVVNVTQKINMLKGINLILNEISSVPAVADLDGDGTQDMVFATGAYYVVALNTRNKSLFWAYKISPFSTLSAPVRYASPAITDLNMDGIPDVIIGWANGKVMALNGVSGEIIWEYNAGSSNRIISSVSLADFDKDGIMDPVVTGEDGSVFVLNGSEYAEERVLSNKNNVRNPITSTPALGDINSDGYMEVVLTSVNNKINVFTTPTRVFKNEIFWSSFRRDSKNSGMQFHVDKSFKFQIFIGIGLFLILATLIKAKLSKIKKFKKKPQIIDGRKK